MTRDVNIPTLLLLFPPTGKVKKKTPNPFSKRKKTGVDPSDPGTLLPKL
jgi:hypothetical protein